MRNTKLCLLLIVLLAFGLRMHQLDNSSFWLDEGLTPLRSGYSIAEISSNRITIQDGVTKDTHPPLYYLLIHFSRSLLGESDFSYRYPSVIAGVLLVPLLFQLARRIDDSKVALLAAFLAAVNPLQIWYAQEARMYTLLVLLAAAATLALWKAFSEQRLFRWLALYGVFASLAFYTHYTAIFLIGVQGLFWVWLLWRQGYRRLLIGGAVLGFLITLPLLPFIIPRLFTGSEASYFYVSPLIMMQDVVHGFGLGLTVDFSQAGIKLLDLGGLLLLLAGLIGSRRPGKAASAWSSRSFLLAYLLAAVVGLMLGSLIKPMYMGARHIMVGSPAFLLLVARGLFALPRRPFYLAPLVGAAVILVGPAVSLHNLYHNPYYAKDDVRALIKHVERQAGHNDLLLYNNAIQLPVHWHYQQRQDLSATALPVYPHPAGPDTELQLQTLAEQFERIWFIGDLPADGRDDSMIVRRWLAEHLTVVDQYSAHGRNMQARVVAYRTGPSLVEALPAGGRALDLRWEGLPPLRGLRFDSPGAVALPALWLDLFWGTSPPAPGRSLRFALRGPDGETWLDHSQPFLPGEAQPWPGSGLVRSSYSLPISAGTPPGEYTLWLLPWDSASGQAMGDWEKIASVELAASSQWPLVPDWPLAPFPLRFDNQLELLGLSDVTAEVRPGHALPLSLYWRAPTLPDELRYQLEVVGPDGNILRTLAERPGPDWLDESTWPPDTVIMEQIGLYFPPDAEPGRYRLCWRLLLGETNVPGRPAWRPWSSESVVFGHVVVQPWPLETELPAVSNLLRAEVGAAIELYGYELEGKPFQPSGLLDLTLYWRARAAPDNSYHAFVHLVSAGDGTIVSQLDRVPVDWLRPTNGWRPDEVLTDSYQLTIPKDLAPGAYHLYVGMYDPDNWQRLPITYQGEVQDDGRLLLTAITVP